MKYIRKILSKLIICILCITCIFTASYALSNIPEVGEYGNWVIEDNMETFHESMSEDINNAKPYFIEGAKQSNFVPLEVKLGLMFMQAMSPIGEAIQKYLNSFTITFLFIMYAFWIGLNAYKMIRESTDYKTVFYEIFKKGAIIVIWVLVLSIDSNEFFSNLIKPILYLGTYISDFILKNVANAQGMQFTDTCQAIHTFVNESLAAADHKLLVGDADTAAAIMCVPGRMSTFFYHALGVSWEWIKAGFRLGTPITSTIVGIVAAVMFIKCIFKYAFMTLGIVADLFFTIFMLPFTALAESMPSINEKNYAGQIFSGLLKVFNTKKFSDVLATFINVAVYFVSLSIVISICSILLELVKQINSGEEFTNGNAMTVLLIGCLVLHIADKTEELASQLGGKVNNAFGKQLQSDTKTIWNDIKSFGKKATFAWSKGKFLK